MRGRCHLPNTSRSHTLVRRTLQLRFVVPSLWLFIALSLPALAFAQAGSETESLVAAARAQIGVTVGYDPSYRQLSYPGGDVPSDTGVCTDVVIRAYRRLGIDLQKEIHEDMTAHFALYPSRSIWGLSRPDKNIDHRRVPNMQTFFMRQGASLSPSSALAEARPGDLLTWRLSSGVPHIGIVSDRRADSGKRPLVIHNIGAGVNEEDMAAEYEITGWYRYIPK